MIDVSCAIIIKEGKVLAVQRGPHTDHPFQWEFPGGKVQKDEMPEQSIRREIMEELSVEVEVIEKLIEIEHDYGIKQIRLIPFVCRIKDGVVNLTEHLSSCWLLPCETEIVDWSQADRKLIENNSTFFNIQKPWKI